MPVSHCLKRVPQGKKSQRKLYLLRMFCFLFLNRRMAYCHVLLLFNIIEVLLQLRWWLQDCYILANKYSKCDESPLCCTFLWIACLYNMWNTTVGRIAFLKGVCKFLSRFLVLLKCTVEYFKLYGYLKSILKNLYLHTPSFLKSGLWKGWELYLQIIMLIFLLHLRATEWSYLKVLYFLE